MSKLLKQMQVEVHNNNVAHGWFDGARTFGDDIALLHSEVSEAFEAWRDYGLVEKLGPGGKPEGVGSELADILIRLLDACQRYDIDLEIEYETKMAYNRTRPFRHGNKRV